MFHQIGAAVAGVLLDAHEDRASVLRRSALRPLQRRRHLARVHRVDAIVGVGRLAVELGDCLAALDVNPLIAGPEGCVAVDALVVARSP